MKKIFAVSLAMLLAFGLLSCSDPTSSGGGGGGEPTSTMPALGNLTSASYELNTTATVGILRITVTNTPAIETLKYQWYKAATETAAGETVGTNSRDFTPPVNVAGTVYYWVVVTNTATDESATSNKARIMVYEPTGDSEIERIVSNNSSMPLWEFELPDGVAWADYEEFSIEYYVSKFSKANERSVRSRLYGAYLSADFDIPDQGDAKGWGGFRMINWNSSTKIVRDGEATIIPNDNFILDNTRATAAALGTLFAAESGGVGKWFTVKYDATGASGHGSLKNFAKVTLLDSSTIPAIYVGAGIFQDGGDAGGNYEFYTKNPTLLHKDNPDLNIRGNRFKSGTTEKLFAGNGGADKSGTDRAVVTEYEDVDGQIQISFNLVGGTGSFPPIKIMPGKLGNKFPSAEPERNNWQFLGWYDSNDVEVDAEYEFTDTATITAKWAATASRLAHPYPSATTETDVPLGAFNSNAANNNQPGWETSDGGLTVAEFVWATKLQFELDQAFVGGCRLNWGNESEGWGTGTHDTAITGNDGTPTAVMTLELDDDDDPTVWTYTVDLTKLAGYDAMIMSQTLGQLNFQYWGSGDFVNFATTKPANAKLIIPPAE